jgi:hypothetical protein
MSAGHRNFPDAVRNGTQREFGDRLTTLNELDQNAGRQE